MSKNLDKSQMADQEQRKASVRYVEIDHSAEGQRLDNFLLKELKGAPKSLIYRILRKGEVRLNKKRAKPMQKLCLGDSVRIPPVRLDAGSNQNHTPGEGLKALLRESICYEDEYLLVINKPSGLAVHGGSGVSLGLIESLRDMGVGNGYLELVHRLDKETSGCLLLAKKRSTLVALHEMIRRGDIKKTYQTLVVGRWPKTVRTVDAPLQKNTLASGERMVKVHPEGKASVTHFRISQEFEKATLLEVRLDTGRTHQIRVHTQLTGHPVLGDGKYGSKQSLEYSRKIGLNRLFLHASALAFNHPQTGQKLVIESPLPGPLCDVLDTLRK